MTEPMRDLPGGFKETEIGPIPVDWDVVRLGEVVALTMGQSPPSSTYNTDGAGLPFLQGKAEFGETYPTPVKWCSRPQKVTDRGSVLISVRAPVGDVNMARDGYCIGRGLAAINGSESLDNWFLFYLLIFAKRRLEERGTGSTFKSINKGVLQNFSIPLPPLPEQRRIAHVLSTIQRAIAAQDDLIAAAREVKRSLMQRLFTYGPGPEPAPTKETEIGEIPEHWEVVRLADVVRQKITDGTHKTPNYVSRGTPFITVTNLDDGRIDFSMCKFVSPEEHQKLAQRCRPEPGDVLLSKVGTLGLVALVEEGFEFSIFVQLALIKPRFHLIAPAYLKGALSSAPMQQQILQHASLSTMKYIGVGKIAQLQIPLPPMAEQQEIAHILSAADRKIEAEEQRKAALQVILKAMLHQLMTGQLRMPGVAAGDVR